MKKEEKNKWRESEADEITQKIEELEAQLYKFKHQLHIGQLKNFSVIKGRRRDVSVLKTLLKEKKAAGVKKNGVEKNKKN